MLPSTPADLARILEMDDEQAMVSLAGAAHRLYTCWYQEKPNGGKRLIEAPFPDLKKCQRLLSEKILGAIPIHAALHGRPGTSQITAASRHVGQPVVITMDLREFFPSTTARMINCALVRNGFDPKIAEIVTKLTTTKRRLPQGAPTSPVLARIVISPILTRIEGLLESISLKCRFAQYVDDLSLSGPAGLQRVMPSVTRIFKQNGFEINPKKTKVMRGGDEKEVLGIRVNYRLEPGRKFERKIADARQAPNENRNRLTGLLGYRRTVLKANTPH